jgi:electron transfer flavoprotein alpha subunit
MVYLVDDPLLEDYQPDLYVSIFKQVCETVNPTAIVMGNTLMAIDLAPRISFYLNAGLVTDCVGFEFKKGEVLATKPVFSSNIIAVYAFDSKPYMVTLRSKSEEPAVRGDLAKGEIVFFEATIDSSLIRTPIIKKVVEKEEWARIDNAEMIVAGGRGIGSAEGFAQLSKLAEVIGAALGASRPPCDLGWVPSKLQIGQTGTIVKPSVYFAIGISGSTAHLAGMLGSKTIVAINKDADATIFRVANYGVVEKYEEVLPAFIAEVKEILEERKRLKI